MNETIQYFCMAFLGALLAAQRWQISAMEIRLDETRGRLRKIQRGLTATQLRIFNEMDKEERHLG